jgi:uncharacterized protein YecE (DUF72 family)
MSERVRVGVCGFPVRDRRKVLAAVDFVELNDGRFEPPAKAAARRLKKGWPATVAATAQCSTYLVEAPRRAVSLPGEMARYGGFQATEENVALWARGLDFAEAVGALALVVITPPTFTPGPANVARMQAFLASAERRDLRIVWEPHGPWAPEHAARLAAEMGLALAVDPLRDTPPEGDFAYLRLGAFAAMGGRLGVYDLERLAEAALGFDEALCAFDTPRAVDDVRNLKAILAGAEIEESDDDDDGEGDDDDDSDFDDDE